MGAFLHMSNFITRAKGHCLCELGASSCEYPARETELLLLQRVQSSAAPQAPCVCPLLPRSCGAAFWRDQFVWQLRAFPFALSPRGGSDKPSVVQQSPVLPRSGPYQDLPSPPLCAGHFLNASFKRCHCN